MVWLIFIFNVDISGKFSVLYEKYTDKPNKPYFFSLHFGIINIVANPTNYLKFTYSHDFVSLGTRRIYGEIFLPKIKSDIKFGKFDIPFGFVLRDHTSLLENNVGLGLQRQKVGLAVSSHLSIFEISTGIFTPYKGKLDIFSSTISIKYNFIDIGYGRYNWQPDTLYKHTCNEIYGELNPKKYLSLLYKYILFNNILGSKEHKFYGYHIGLKFYPPPTFFGHHPFIVPFIEYEFFDPDKETSEDVMSRIAYGIELETPIGLTTLIKYYNNKEEGIEIKNNLFVIMLMMFF